MTVSEAWQVLLHPRFGDERCIEAHKLLLLSKDVREARSYVESNVESKWCDCEACRAELAIESLPPIESMTTEHLTEELKMWTEYGYELPAEEQP